MDARVSRDISKSLFRRIRLSASAQASDATRRARFIFIAARASDGKRTASAPPFRRRFPVPRLVFFSCALLIATLFNLTLLRRRDLRVDPRRAPRRYRCSHAGVTRFCASARSVLLPFAGLSDIAGVRCRRKLCLFVINIYAVRGDVQNVTFSTPRNPGVTGARKH